MKFRRRAWTPEEGWTCAGIRQDDVTSHNSSSAETNAGCDSNSRARTQGFLGKSYSERRRPDPAKLKNAKMRDENTRVRKNHEKPGRAP